MDEERGDRRGRRNKKKNRNEEMTSLAAASEHDREDSSNDDEHSTNCSSDDEHSTSDDGEEERTGFLRTYPLATTTGRTTTKERRQRQRRRSKHQKAPENLLPGWDTWLHKTLLPDSGFSIKGHVVIGDNNNGGGAAGGSSAFITKLLKFIVWTFVSIAIVHLIVSHLFDDRDKVLKIAHIWRYESDLIVRDCVVFFCVGRLWEKQGIDHLAWMGTALLANVYFESQNFVWFLQHSVTLFQMHCIWPWELWVFALVLIVAAALLVGAHVVKAWNDKTMVSRLTELGLCVLFFMAPVITSDYFHLHHWYAGWLMGMQFNYDVWWSRLAMAWCWGMYVNGIAVYGRDPVLTCEYAYFLSLDNRCPYMKCYVDGVADKNNTSVKEMVPVDWRNCSATDDFHP